MFRKISETFTATHFTILAAIAMLVPGAVFATVATTAVSITDPNTGQKAFVDAARRLSVYDAAAGFANNPANYVKISGQCINAVGKILYKVPAGKALIIKSANFTYDGGVSGDYNAEVVGDQSGSLIAEFESSFVSDSRSFDFGNGFTCIAAAVWSRPVTTQETTLSLSPDTSCPRGPFRPREVPKTPNSRSATSRI